jgi:hypothetical protein
MTTRGLVIAGFAALALLAVATEVVARASVRGATLGAVLTAGLRTPVTRVVIVAAWLWTGFHFLAR